MMIMKYTSKYRSVARVLLLANDGGSGAPLRARQTGGTLGGVVLRCNATFPNDRSVKICIVEQSEGE